MKYYNAIFDSYLSQRGKRYRDCRLANFKKLTKAHLDAVEKIKNWLADVQKHFDAGRGVILFGPAGTGKDHLITAVLVEAIKSGCFPCPEYEATPKNEVVWANGPTLFSEMRDAIGSDEREADAKAKYVGARLAMFSDICQSGNKLTDHQRQTFYSILDKRYSRCKPTWFSTNAANRGELSEMLGGDVADRLLGDSLVVPCVWESYRKPLNELGQSDD
ncbi:MAG: ATP-binding protein [Pirellulaceae bacterium]|nr:ATP-binding protein [Pirellulaceae bacterium]